MRYNQHGAHYVCLNRWCVARIASVRSIELDNARMLLVLKQECNLTDGVTIEARWLLITVQ